MTTNISNRGFAKIHTKQAAMAKLESLEREREFMRREFDALTEHKKRIENNLENIALRLAELNEDIVFEIYTLPKNLMAERDAKYPVIQPKSKINILEFERAGEAI